MIIYMYIYICVCVHLYVCLFIYKYVSLCVWGCIYTVKVKLATIVEGDPKAPFSIATTLRCTE